MNRAAGNLGFSQFRNVAAEIEKNAKAGEFSSMSAKIQKLEQEFETAWHEIKRKISTAAIV
jgi:HPt (histidine-containing phosphotransfer) domain-containing protein